MNEDLGAELVGIKNRLTSLETGQITMQTKIDNVEGRVTALESVSDNVEEILEVVKKLAKYIKASGPTIIGAALTAGIVNGKLGAFLAALIH